MIKLPVSSLRPYLNRALLFTNQAKMGLKPIFSCLYLEKDKAYVYNGETGIIINFPFSVDKPVMLFPFDLARVLNGAKEDAEITLTLDTTALTCLVTVSGAKLKIKLMDPALFETVHQVPADLKKIPVDGIYSKIKNALFATSNDASLPKFQCVQVTPTHVCATDQRVIWRETFPFTEPLLVPKQFAEQISRLGAEPTAVVLADSTIYFFYPDAIVYTLRLQDEVVPDLNKVIVDRVLADGDTAVVKYDKEQLSSRLELLTGLLGDDGALEISCEKGILRLQNVLDGKDANVTEAEIAQEVASTADFGAVFINAKLFREGINQFHQFAVKADGRRLYFSNSSGQEYVVSRRAP